MVFRKYILFPFSFLYGCITAVRNFLYDKKIKKSYAIPGKSIVIGNLSMGGTGKSPHTLYLWHLLSKNNKIAILSRGYGRKTKGLIEVLSTHLSTEVGDEPLMFKKRVGEETQVVVAEQRKLGVEWILSQKKDAIILLDDAFQHRKVTAGFSILLTDFNKPFFNDFVVPSGTLREWAYGKKRADCVIVTKCPDQLTIEEKKNYVNKIESNLIKPKKSQFVFFSKIIYGDLIPFGKEKIDVDSVLLVTGIANSTPLEQHLKRFYNVESINFSDHYQFTEADLVKIHTKFDTFTSEKSIIVTTEKDFVRLESLLTTYDKTNYPWYFQSISIKLDEEEKFNALINNYVNTI